MFERLVSFRLGRFIERNGVLPTTQFAYRKGLGTCDSLFCVSHTLQSALESLQSAKIVKIDFSAAFDRVNHQGILYIYRLCSVGIGGWVVYTGTVSVKSITARYYYLLLKKVVNARIRESDINPIGPKTSALQYQPIDRKKRKGKRVEDYSRDRAA